MTTNLVFIVSTLLTTNTWIEWPERHVQMPCPDPTPGYGCLAYHYRSEPATDADHRWEIREIRELELLSGHGLTLTNKNTLLSRTKAEQRKKTMVEWVSGATEQDMPSTLFLTNLTVRTLFTITNIVTTNSVLGWVGETNISIKPWTNVAAKLLNPPWNSNMVYRWNAERAEWVGEMDQ